MIIRRYDNKNKFALLTKETQNPSLIPFYNNNYR
jgi:hypothetical protein